MGNNIFNKLTIQDYDLKDKTVLVRVDYNLPLDDNGHITNDYRVRQSLPTIKYLLEQNCRLVLISHLGRPAQTVDLRYSLKKVLKSLENLLPDQKISFFNNCIGEDRNQRVRDLQPQEILLLENLRFYPGEEANDSDFAQSLAQEMDVFVQDGFGVVHRAHASTEAITHFLPSLAGLLLEREVTTINNMINNPERPLMAIIGGAKIADKIELINKFIDIADSIVIGGAMANTFLKADGQAVGDSLSDDDELPLARDIYAKLKAKASKDFNFVLPFDAVVTTTIASDSHLRLVDWDSHVVSEILNYPKRVPRRDVSVQAHEKIVDIGPFSGAFIAGNIQKVQSVVWNGTLGITETKALIGDIGPFAHGTNLVIEALLGQFGHKPVSLIGGGDTTAYLEQRGLIEAFDHVSTGGGASLELMAGHQLPGYVSLLDKPA